MTKAYFRDTIGALLVPIVMRMFLTDPLNPSFEAWWADPIQMLLSLGFKGPVLTWLIPFATQLVPLYAKTSSLPQLFVPV